MCKRDWRIYGDGVGDIRLNQPIPDYLLNDEDLADRYFAQLIADAQVFEGFELEAPPIMVGIEDGPLAQSGDTDGELKTEQRGREALELARAGAVVSMISITAPTLTTEAGVGVGSTLDELTSAYPDLSLNPTPPTFGNDQCAASTATLENVHFTFKNCDGARSGLTVSRVLIFP